MMHLLCTFNLEMGVVWLRLEYLSKMCKLNALICGAPVISSGLQSPQDLSFVTQGLPGVHNKSLTWPSAISRDGDFERLH